MYKRIGTALTIKNGVQSNFLILFAFKPSFTSFFSLKASSAYRVGSNSCQVDKPGEAINIADGKLIALRNRRIYKREEKNTIRRNEFAVTAISTTASIMHY